MDSRGDKFQSYDEFELWVDSCVSASLIVSEHSFRTQFLIWDMDRYTPRGYTVAYYEKNLEIVRMEGAVTTYFNRYGTKYGT